MGKAHRIDGGRRIRRYGAVLLHRLRRGVSTWGALISYAVAGYVYKVMVEVILLPVTYAVIRAIKKQEPGYAAAPSHSGSPVHQMRLVMAVDDYDKAVRFYRDELGLVEETYEGEHGARVMILGAGRATLELSNRPQIDLIDTVEVGRTGVSGKYRLAFEVDDSASVTDRLVSAGAELIAAPTMTPWRSLNARLQGPGDATDDLHRASETEDARKDHDDTDKH